MKSPTNQIKRSLKTALNGQAKNEKCKKSFIFKFDQT